MLKFFRKIRQQLLLENNFSRYLLYATGEILLVMIGILLALQVSNWNTHQNERKQEQLLLLNLKHAYVFNLKSIKRTSEDCQNAYYASKNILDLISPNVPSYQKNQLESFITSMINYSSYNPSNGAIEEILNSGQLSLIQNEDLKNRISNWSGLLRDTYADIKITDNHNFNFLIPYLLEHGNLRNLPLPKALIGATELQKNAKSKFSTNYNDLLTAQKFENLVSFHALNLNYLMREFRSIQSHIEETIAIIESEINQMDNR